MGIKFDLRDVVAACERVWTGENVPLTMCLSSLVAGIRFKLPNVVKHNLMVCAARKNLKCILLYIYRFYLYRFYCNVCIF